MKILKYIVGLILVGLTFASTAMAVNTTVPQSPADGSVLFGNANGTYNSSTTPLMINKTSNYVGIGTTTPIGRLTIQGMNNLSTGIPLSVFNASGTSVLVATNAGNVGIGTTTPASRLDTVGTIRALAVGNATYDPASGTGLELIYRSDLNYGQVLSYDRTAGQYKPLRISGSSISLMNGNVGIGTTSPLSKLNVYGGDYKPIYVQGNDTALAAIQIENTTANDSATKIWRLGVAGSAGYNGSTGGTFSISDNLGTARMVIQNNGNVGIGTTTPTAKLSFPLGTTAANGINFGDATANLYRSTAGAIKTDGTIFAASNVAAGNAFWFNNSSLLMWSTAAIGYTGNAYTFADDSGSIYRQIKAASLYVTATSTATPFLVTNSVGNVGIATTTPNANLHVYGSMALKYTLIPLASTTYTVATSTDNIVYVATTTAATTINLPACIGTTDQVIYSFKDKGGAAGTQNITITATAGDTLDGAATKIINTAYGSTKVQCVSGSGWFVLP